MLFPNFSCPLESLINMRQALKGAIFHSRQVWKLSLSGIAWALGKKEGSSPGDASHCETFGASGVSVATACPSPLPGHDGEAL